MIHYMGRQMRAIHHDRSGQSLIFAAMVMGTLFLFLALTVNVGHFVKGRVEIQTAADATALSGAAWQARGLNLISALNSVSLFYSKHIALEQQQAAFWGMICSAVGWFFPEACVIAGEQAADYAMEQSYATVMGGVPTGAENIERVIAYLQVPLFALGFTTLYAGGIGGGGLNGADITIPFGGSFMFGFIPGWPQLGLNFSPVGISGVRNASLNNEYPDRTWMFAATYRDFRAGVPLLPGVFRQSSLISNGFLAVAQARPFVPPFITQGGRVTPKDLRGNKDTYIQNKAMDWDTKLMPVTIDNFILGFVPFIGPLAGGVITDTLLVH